MFCHCFPSDVSICVSGLVISEPVLCCLVGLVVPPGSEFLIECYVTRPIVPFWLPKEGSNRASRDMVFYGHYGFLITFQVICFYNVLSVSPTKFIPQAIPICSLV